MMDQFSCSEYLEVGQGHTGLSWVVLQGFIREAALENS
jgi:hypothetical protein